MLSELKVGESGVLVSLDLPESVQNHLMHMGFVPDALVTALRRAPAGDPTVYCVDGLEIALRRETAAAIEMRAADEDEREMLAILCECEPVEQAAEKGRNMGKHLEKHPAGAEAHPLLPAFCGPTKVVPLLQDLPELSFSAACEATR